MINFFNSLKKILFKSLSYCEKKIFLIIIKYFKLINIELIKIRKVINLYLYNNYYNYMYISHIDTVSESNVKWILNPFLSLLFKKKIINRGIIDMKGSFISVLFFNKKILNFILTNDEESVSIYGIQYTLNILNIRKKKIYFFMGTEPTSENIIGDYTKISRRGSFNLKIIFLGKNKHCAYIGKNLIKMLFKNFFFLKNDVKKFNILEYTNIFCGNNSDNFLSNKLFLKINFRFNFLRKIIILKKKFLKFLISKNVYIVWKLSGIPFFCYKNFFLKNIFNIIYYIQNIKTKINFLGGTSDLRYCFYIYQYSEIFELGLINKSIHKINENCFLDDCLILSIIFYYFIYGIK
ncbi:M20/M25/M40 family metallo-hydrolase [Candidatus Carsonella ruddii]|uniref:Succinyl-diaminopimelate desuccinylase n=1 Tax=Candidatus Carsonella ruddii PC isolate NHV TaxID=1202540 RepID=J3Z1V4_CARRU|nr:M20/M25/M40 family metallo-hydrolase [Candidatus Carsonella ruddii]AFP84244.1 succinyl-diaminopimelate desuccinylase [Candidatus Carsonella ruddii PC isolate NHV]